MRGARGRRWGARGVLAALVLATGATAAAAQGFALPPWAATPASRQQALAVEEFVAPSAIVFPRTDAGTCRRDLVGSLVASDAIGLDATFDTAGAAAGGAIGRDMDTLDRRCVGQVLEHAPTGSSVTWRNPDRNTEYRVTATRTFDIGSGRYCREFRTVATLTRGEERFLGTACRAATGAWRTIN